ncbi:hypothetical protein KAW64_16505, partial [bacterium]|nr:hypothetical protein [bacterium]
MFWTLPVTFIALAALLVFARLPFALRPTLTHNWGSDTRGVVVDLDGDGLDELVCPAEHRGEMLAFALRGSSFAPLEQCNFEGTAGLWQDTRFAGCVDVDGDSWSEMVIGYVRAGTLHIRAYGLERGIVADVAVASGLDRFRGDGWDGFLSGVAQVDLGAGAVGVLASVMTDFDLYPRELVMFDASLRRVLWRHPAGTWIHGVMARDLDGDGNDEIVFGSAAPGNGASAGGTDDGHSYVGVLSADGREIWLETAGGSFTSTQVKVADMNRDDVDEVVSLTTPE